MTHRERVQAALAFEPPDELPCHESPWEQTVDAWRRDGLPAGVTVEDFFNFDLSFMYLDVSPQYDHTVLSSDDRHITYEDRFGYTVTKSAGMAATLHFHEHKTTGPDAWERTRSGLRLSDDPHAPARIDDASYFAHHDPYPTWGEAVAKYHRVRAQDRYLLFACYGPWEATWRHRGMQPLLTDVAMDPDWVVEMADTYQDLVLSVLERCLDLGMKPDGLFTADDLGASTGPLMAPSLWATLFKPVVSRLGAFLETNGIDFWLHSDGAIGPMIDDFVDCGVRVLNPLEAKAGMDILDLRKRYGQRLSFFGNIDVTKMFGPIDVLRAELERKVPLARDGGYILHSDHSCPPEVTFERYCWMLDTARAIFKSR